MRMGAIAIEQSIQVGGKRNIFIYSQVGKIISDLIDFHFSGMTFLVKQFDNKIVTDDPSVVAQAKSIPRITSENS